MRVIYLGMSGLYNGIAMGEMESYKNDRISLKNLNEFSVMVLHIWFMLK
jgi:hypothetical protein